MTTLTDLRAAVQTAAETTAGSPLTTVPGYASYGYEKYPKAAGTFSSASYYVRIDGNTTSDTIHVDDLAWLRGDTDTDIQVNADDVGGTTYFQQSAGADALWGAVTSSVLTVGTDVVSISMYDYGPIDVAGGDDYWTTHSITTVPTGYAATSHLWDGLSAPVTPGATTTPPVRWTYLLTDESTGTNIGELPLTITSAPTRLLNGCGSMGASLPLDHPLATTAGFEADRGITVLRGNTPIYNGPISVEDSTLSGRMVNLTVREASWYWWKRVLEVTKTYDGTVASNDLFDIIRDLWAYFTTKTSTVGDGYTPSGSNIHAAVPRFVFDPPTAPAGQTRNVVYDGAARHYGSDILDDLVKDPATGIDWRMNYDAGSSRQQCIRTMTLGSPSLGVTLNHPLVERVLAEFTKTEDRERAANRVHTVGSGYTYTLQNQSSIDVLGDILIEAVFDRSDTSNPTAVQSTSRAARLATYPPVTSHVITSAPELGPLPFGWCDLGDSIYLNTSEAVGLLHSVGHRRVTEIQMIPPSDQSPELFAVTVSIPLDTVT